MWHGRLPLALGLLASAWAQESFIFLNARGADLQLTWLPQGPADTGPGTPNGGALAGSLDRPAVVTIGVGSKGHAFRMWIHARSIGTVVYQGGGINLVGVGDADHEVLGTGQLQRLVNGLVRACQQDRDYKRCCYGRARTPALGIRVPAETVDQLMQAFSPLSKRPEVVTSRPRDAVFILSTLPYAVDVYWAYLADESDKGTFLADGEEKLMGQVPVAPTPQGELPYAVLRAEVGAIFFAAGPPGSGGHRRKARAFSYPGELFLAVLRECPDAPGELAVDTYGEDTVKVFISDVLYGCALQAGVSPAEIASRSGLKWGWQSCLAKGAKLRESGALLPAALGMEWLRYLWVDVNHWLLCSFQRATAPVEVTEARGSAGGGNDGAVMRAEVLRRSPLVVVVHSVATAEECASLRAAAGDHDALGLAHTSSGTTSRDRRTLAVNLYPDHRDANSTLAMLQTRFFEVARQLTGYELGVEGQEPVNWLYYKPGYEYRPHCDGSCGMPRVALGDRVASSLLYCGVAEEGGGTVFPPDGLKVEPKAGMMLLFTYNPDPERVSEHAACPVLRGDKMTATQWYRQGVSEEVPWESFRRGRLEPKPKPKKPEPKARARRGQQEL